MTYMTSVNTNRGAHGASGAKSWALFKAFKKAMISGCKARKLSGNDLSGMHVPAFRYLYCLVPRPIKPENYSREVLGQDKVGWLNPTRQKPILSSNVDRGALMQGLIINDLMIKVRYSGF